MTSRDPKILSDEGRWYLLASKRYENDAAAAYSYFQSRSIEPILIKGIAIARLYPSDVHRYFGDVDIAVSPSDFSAAEDILRSASGLRAGVDLHCGLRHLDTLPWDRLMANSELIHFDSGPVRVLCPEDHLRVLATHWLTDGGANRERLWDIYYAVSNRTDDFDWDKCLSVVSGRRRGWVLITIALAHRYLSLDIDDLPFRDELRDIPEWVTRTVEREWESGLPLRPLHTCLRDPKAMMQQIRKRIPPNPIQATVEMEGDLLHGSRHIYQFANFFQRISPSLKRVVPAIFKQ